MNISALLSLTFLLLSVQVKAGVPACESLFDDSQIAVQNDEDALKRLIKPTKSPSKTIRSSAGHFWLITSDIIENKILSDLSKKEREILKELMKIEGWVVGDLHNGNVGPARVGVGRLNPKGEIDYIVVDYDDPAPKGALIFDLLHHIIAAKAVDVPEGVKISKQELFKMYLTGLKGKKIKFPERIEKLLNMTPEEFEQLEIAKAKKFTAANGVSLIKDGERSSAIDEADFKEVKSVIEKAIGRYYEVLDIGGREKEEGGSAGALRFMALLKDKQTGENFLFDLKEAPPSAVEEYKKQPDYTFEDRLNHFVHQWHEKDYRFQVVKVNSNGKVVSMILRPRPLYFFDYANDGSKNAAFKEFRDLSLFNAYWLGFKQRRDDRVKADKLQNIIDKFGEDEVFDSVKSITRVLNQVYADQSATFVLQNKEKKKKDKEERKGLNNDQE